MIVYYILEAEGKSYTDDEYNKALATAVKKAYPDCTVIFGGHNVLRDFETFEECCDRTYSHSFPTNCYGYRSSFQY